MTKKSPYSIDQNLWGRAVETGFLEDIWNAPIEDVYSYTSDPSVPRDADEVVITFDARRRRSRSTARPVTMLEAVLELNKRAGAQGIGRLDIVEDRLVGIKSREVYEAPGAIALITAHQELENVTVERDLARFKKSVDQRWGELVYDGLWFSPLKRALDGFLDDANAHVSGDVRLDAARRASGRDRPPQRRSRSTTTSWRPTTPATCSTSRWPRASSSSGACPARWPPAATRPTPTPPDLRRGPESTTFSMRADGSRRACMLARPSQPAERGRLAGDVTMATNAGRGELT